MVKARIMIVEDEALVALQIKEALESAGYGVPGVAASGEEAIAMALDTEPDLILMDIHLKGTIDGIQTANRIRERFDIPVIYLTAYSDTATVERAKETEPFGYILKPISDRSLQLSIEMTLQKARKEQSLKENSEWFSSILKGIGQGIIVLNLKGIIKFVNPFTEKITGWSQEDVAEQPLSERYRFLDSSTGKPVSFDETIIEGRIIRGEECLLFTRDGRKIPIDYTIAPLTNRNDTIAGLVFIFYEKENRAMDILEGKDKTPGHILPQKGFTIGGFSIDWYFHPSTISSGDSFNFFPLDGTHAGFFILDVAGYGLTSALFSLNLHTFLSPDAERGGILAKRKPDGSFAISSPLEVVNELNRRFYFEEKYNLFFTLVYGIIDTSTGRTKVVRAGHPYPVYQNAGGDVHYIKAEGGAVGMFADISIHEFEFNFEKKARLFLYSDGLIDSSFADINQESFNRLIHFITKNRETPLKDIHSNLETEITIWKPSRDYTDDATLFVIERIE